LAFVVPLSQLPKKIGALARVENFSASQALNRTAFLARKKVIANMESKFTIKSEWVRKGVLVNPSSAKTEPIEAIVFHRYWGIAQQEEGGSRKKTRTEPWIVPTRAGRKWLEAAGFTRRKPGLKRILKTEVGGRKPFFKRTGPRPGTGRGKGRRFQLKPENISGGSSTLIWTRTSSQRIPIKLIFIAYDKPLRIDPKPWFESIVEETYNKNFPAFFKEALKINLKKFAILLRAISSTWQT